MATWHFAHSIELIKSPPSKNAGAGLRERHGGEAGGVEALVEMRLVRNQGRTS